MADAFHQATVANEYPGPVIDDREAGTIETAGHQFFGQRHADRVGQALAERAGSRFDTFSHAGFRVPRGAAAHLAEALQVVQAEGVAGQMQQAIEQHRGVTIGQHETVAVSPRRIGRIVRKYIQNNGLGDIVEVDSAGTHGYHVGEAPDPRTQRAALVRGYNLSQLRARKVARQDIDYFDLILAMDKSNLDNLRRMAPPTTHERIKLFMDFPRRILTTMRFRTLITDLATALTLFST